MNNPETLGSALLFALGVAILVAVLAWQRWDRRRKI